MKNYILLVSLGAALVASILGITAVLGQNVNTLEGTQAAVDTVLSTVKLYQLAGISGLFSISSFFVGLAYPKSIILPSDATYTKIAG